MPEQISDEYKVISTFQIVNGTPTCAVENMNGTVSILYGDKKYGPFQGAYYLSSYKNCPAFIVKQNTKLKLFLEDKEHASAEDFKRSILRISNKPAYAAKENGKWYAVWGGTRYGPYDDVRDLTDVNGFFAFTARKGEKSFVVLDGAEQESYKSIGGLCCIDKQPAYAVQTENDKQHVVFRGYHLPEYEYIGGIVPHKNTVSYTARKAQNTWCVVEGEKEHQTRYLVAALRSLQDQLIYFANDDNKWRIVQDGELHPQHAGVGDMRFFGYKFGYIAYDDACSLILEKESILEAPNLSMLRSIHSKPCLAKSTFRQFPVWGIWWDGNETAQEYKQIGDICEYQQGYTFAAQKQNNLCAIFKSD